MQYSILDTLNLLSSMELNLSTGQWNLVYIINDSDQYNPVRATYSRWHNQYRTLSTSLSSTLIIFSSQYIFQLFILFPWDLFIQYRLNLCKGMNSSKFVVVFNSYTVGKQLDGSRGNCLESRRRLCTIYWQNCQWVNDHGELAERCSFLNHLLLAGAGLPHNKDSPQSNAELPADQTDMK